MKLFSFFGRKEEPASEVPVSVDLSELKSGVREKSAGPASEQSNAPSSKPPEVIAEISGKAIQEKSKKNQERDMRYGHPPYAPSVLERDDEDESAKAA